MKRKELKQIVNEAVKEVFEALTVQVQKDPALMSSDEKKKAANDAKLKAGISDPNTPVDLIKKEGKGKLREMSRSAILYKLAPDWQEKYAEAAKTSENSRWYESPARKKWMDGIIKYLRTEYDEDGTEIGPAPDDKSAAIKTIAKDYFNAPQQMLKRVS